MNREIEHMLRHPGKYAVTTMALPQPGARYVRVEVLPDGTCHQLTPEGKRDGCLSPIGWSPMTRVYVMSDDGDVFVRLPVPDNSKSPIHDPWGLGNLG